MNKRNKYTGRFKPALRVEVYRLKDKDILAERDRLVNQFEHNTQAEMTTTNHQPATVFTEEIVRRANAYPRLVALVQMMNHMGGDERGGYCICPLNDGSAPDSRHASGCADARALLHDLGEE